MIPAESAHDVVAALGDVGLLQFKDLNSDKSAFQRTYANQVLTVTATQSSVLSQQHQQCQQQGSAPHVCSKQGHVTGADL